MCLAIPGRVLDTRHENGVLMGTVDFSGVTKQICLDLVPKVSPEEFVLVHVGFALATVDAAQAAKIFEALEELRQLEELESTPT